MLYTLTVSEFEHQLWVAKPLEQWSLDPHFSGCWYLARSVKVVNNAAEREDKLVADIGTTITTDPTQRQALSASPEIYRFQQKSIK